MYKSGRLLVSLCLLAVSAMLTLAQPVLAQSPFVKPDTILVNGKIITADNDDPTKVTVVEAIAIFDGKIIATGSNADIKAMAIKETEIVDLDSRTVVPGLIDTHSHLYETSLGFPWAADVDPQLLSIALVAKSEDEGFALAEAAIRARAKGFEPHVSREPDSSSLVGGR